MNGQAPAMRAQDAVLGINDIDVTETDIEKLTVKINNVKERAIRQLLDCIGCPCLGNSEAVDQWLMENKIQLVIEEHKNNPFTMIYKIKAYKLQSIGEISSEIALGINQDP